jgi:signal transduction histidine kinase
VSSATYPDFAPQAGNAGPSPLEGGGSSPQTNTIANAATTAARLGASEVIANIPPGLTDRWRRGLATGRALLLGAGVVIAAVDGSALTWRVALAALVLAALTAADLRGLLRHDLRAALESMSIVAVATALSGGLASPFAALIAVEITAVGIAAGYLTAATSAVVAIAFAGAAGNVASMPASGDPVRTIFLIAVAIALGGFLQSVGRDNDRTMDALGQIRDLAEANRLLADVHRALRSLPAAPDLHSVVATTLTSLRGSVPFLVAALVLADDQEDRWSIVHAEGLRPEGARLPVAGWDNDGVVFIRDLEGTGLHRASTSGIYAPLDLHGQRVGWLALEHDEPDVFGVTDIATLEGLRDPLAIAIDNARLIDRVGRLTGEFERSRLARDLHDRLCQSLAAMAVSLQRAALRSDDDDLSRLAELVRDDLVDLRETLYELRTGPTSDKALADVLPTYARRYSERTGIHVDLAVSAEQRAPLVVEQQLFRIIQEALLNVERHAGAFCVDVTWRVAADGVHLEIGDDGRGFDPTEPVTADRTGLRAMRERARTIGAHVEILSSPGDGTVVAITS